MSERLQQLQRQRRLLEEHLAWLDREILRETGAAPSSSPAAEPTAALPAGPDHVSANAEVELEATSILAEYEQDPRSLQGDVKRGCLTAFAIAMGTLILAVALTIFIYSRDNSENAAPPAQSEAE